MTLAWVYLFSFCFFVFGVVADVDQRPRYHFLPPKGWQNDPNGPFFWNGYYHFMFQYNPQGDDQADLSWGHAASKDLLTWQYLPVALSPDKPYDNWAVMDGSAFITDDGPMVIYCGNGGGSYSINLAKPANLSDPLLIVWEKVDYNPIVTLDMTPNGSHYLMDPSEVWKGGDGHYHFLAGSGNMTTGTGGGGGEALLFSSPDLISWRFDKVFARNQNKLQGEFWGCLEFYKPDFSNTDRYIFTHYSIVFYIRNEWTIGSFNNRTSTFVGHTTGTYDDGYAICPHSLSDPINKRRVSWIWQLEDDQLQGNRYWSGSQSLPRQLSVNEHSQLIAIPVPELNSLRDNETWFENDIILSEKLQTFLIPSVGMYKGISFRITNWTKAQLVGIDVRMSKNQSEFSKICFFSNGTYGIDRRKSSLSDPIVSSDPFRTQPFNPTQTLDVLVYIDASVVEIYVGGGLARMSARIYPTLDDSINMQLFATGGGAVFQNLYVWDMLPLTFETYTP